MQPPLPLAEYLYSQIDRKKNQLLIFYGFQLLKAINLNDKITLYFEAVSFIAAGMKRIEVARAFNIDYSWLYTLMRIYKKSGYQGILDLRRGPKPKITQDIKDFIIERMIDHYKIYGWKNFRDKITSDVKDKYEVTISYDKLRLTLAPYKDEIKGPTSILLNVEDKKKDNEDENVKMNNDKQTEINFKESTIDELLDNGENNRYAGLLLLNYFIECSGILKDFSKVLKGKMHNIKNIIILIIYMLFSSKLKIENYKELNHKELSQIIDITKYKYPYYIRSKIMNNVSFEDLCTINKIRLKHYIEMEDYSERWIFLDGHVVRYYGRRKTTKGFHQQSHTPVKGRINYFMNSCDGRPLFFEMNDFYNDFREMINKFTSELNKILGEKYKEYLFVFDRGGYSYEEFKHLNDKNIKFCTWAKYDKTKYTMLSLEYNTVVIELKGNKINEPVKKEIQVALVDNNYKIKNPNSKDEWVELRKIVIKNGKKHSSLLTNDYSRSIAELAKAIIFRWREEKSFEIEVKYRGLNDINSYIVEDYSKDLIKKLGYEDNGVKYVESKEYKNYINERRVLKKEIEQSRQKLGESIEERKTLEKIAETKKYKKFVEKIKALKTSISEINEKIKACTKKIKKINVLIDNGFKRLDYTQKFFMDIIKITCSHIDYYIMKVLSTFYKNGRDIYKMIDIILQTQGYIKHNNDGEIVVTLNKLNTKNENEVLKSFITYVNQKKSTLIFDKFKKIIFKINSDFK
ncbi:MAG: helix-turn-helix domain-containing protein [Spirochaetes bacterium]|nr:helix-turn-helix domain-containing protein [Spirochaetota bacterium]